MPSDSGSTARTSAVTDRITRDTHRDHSRHMESASLAKIAGAPVLLNVWNGQSIVQNGHGGRFRDVFVALETAPGTRAGQHSGIGVKGIDGQNCY
jgi:hypothetical protein